MNIKIRINKGNDCVFCGNDTSFGNGRFVNRIPADAECGVSDAAGNVIFQEGEFRDGYACAECMSYKCDRCAATIPMDEDITADDIYGSWSGEEFYDGAWRVHEACLSPSEYAILHSRKSMDQ